MDPELRNKLIKLREEYRNKSESADRKGRAWLAAMAATGIAALGLYLRWPNSAFGWCLLLPAFVFACVWSAYSEESLKSGRIARNLSDEKLNRAHKARRELLLHIVQGYPYALYLRNFYSESEGHSFTSPEIVFGGGYGTEPDYIPQNLVQELRPLKIFSPANRSIFGADPQIHWIYLSDSEWTQKVKLYISYASLIVFKVEQLTPNLSSESQMVLETDSACRTLLIISKGQKKQEEYKHWSKFRWVVDLDSRHWTVQLPADLQEYLRQPRRMSRRMGFVGTKEFDSAADFEQCEQLLQSHKIPDWAVAGTMDLKNGVVRWDSFGP